MKQSILGKSMVIIYRNRTLNVFWMKKIIEQIIILFMREHWISTLAVQGSISSKCLRTAFTHADPRSKKKLLNLTVFFALLGSACLKVVHKMLMKLIVQLHNLLFPYFYARAIATWAATAMRKAAWSKRRPTSIKLIKFIERISKHYIMIVFDTQRVSRV